MLGGTAGGGQIFPAISLCPFDVDDEVVNKDEVTNYAHHPVEYTALYRMKKW